MIYNTKLNCTYHIIECDDTYRSEFLEIFYLEFLDEEKLNEKFIHLFTCINNCKNDDAKNVLIECMKKVASLFLVEDLLTGLMILYSYDYFYLMHDCMCELLETDTISLTKITALQNKLEL